MQQRDEDPTARGADGVAKRNRTTVYVHLTFIPAEQFANGQRLRGKGFICFNDVHFIQRPACPGQSRLEQALTGPMPITDGSTPVTA